MSISHLCAEWFPVKTFHTCSGLLCVCCSQPLAFYKKYAKEFPIMAVVGRQYLAVSITSVLLEVRTCLPCEAANGCRWLHHCACVVITLLALQP